MSDESEYFGEDLARFVAVRAAICDELNCSPTHDPLTGRTCGHLAEAALAVLERREKRHGVDDPRPVLNGRCSSCHRPARGHGGLDWWHADPGDFVACRSIDAEFEFIAHGRTGRGEG